MNKKYINYKNIVDILVDATKVPRDEEIVYVSGALTMFTASALDTEITLTKMYKKLDIIVSEITRVYNTDTAEWTRNVLYKLLSITRGISLPDSFNWQ